MCNQELLQSSLLSLAPDCLKAATALGRVQGGSGFRGQGLGLGGTL